MHEVLTEETTVLKLEWGGLKPVLLKQVGSAVELSDPPVSGINVCLDAWLAVNCCRRDFS